MNEPPTKSPRPPKSPRTPKTPKKKTLLNASKSPKTSSGSGSRKLVSMSPSFTPEGWENKRSFLVYEKPKDETKTIKKVERKNQGIWCEGHVATQNPQEVWVYELGEEPQDLTAPNMDVSNHKSSDNNKSKHQHKHIHGVWGYKPGGDPEDPNDVWFFPPNYSPDYQGRDAESLPSYFTQRGVWTFPIIKRDVSQIAPEQTGWIGLAETAKVEKLDVAGTWKMMYKQGANEDSPKGPGMKPRTPKKSPKSTNSSPTKKKLGHINITVEKPDGKPISLRVLPTDTIDDIKDKIETKEGIRKSKQRLYSPFDESLHDPDKTLKDCGIQNGDVLRLDGIRIRVQNNSGDDRADDVFIINRLTPEKTIAEIKQRIEDQEGIEAEDQLLAFHDRLLKDAETLAQNGIKDESVLELQAMTIKVKDNMSKKARKKTYTLGNGDVKPSTTVQEIKQLLEDRHGLPPPDYQRLSLDEVPLDEHDKTLRDYGVAHNSVLSLGPMHVTVNTPDGDSITVEVNPMTDTIRDVKSKVEDDVGIPMADQRLLYNGNILDNPKTVMDYGIRHGDSLDLGGMQVYVQHFNGNVLTLDVTPTNTLADVKEMIETEEGTPTEEQLLLFGSKQLKDDNCTLEGYKIRHGATLKLERMKIFIQTPEGKFPLTVTPTTAIEDLKSVIEKKTNIIPKDQRIHFQGDDVHGDNSATLKDCGIQHRDTLQVEDGGRKDDPTYMVQVSDYRDAFTYVPSPKKNDSPRQGRKIARNKAGGAMGNYFSASKNANVETATWTHTTTGE